MKKNITSVFGFLLCILLLKACSFKDHEVPGPDPVTVYVAGYENIGSVSVAKYWKNGIAVNLTNGVYDARATAITLQGTDVYVSGWEKNSNNKFVAKYWKNGSPIELSDGSTSAETMDIFVKSNDVYVTGNVNQPDNLTYRTGYWKNGIFSELGSGVADAIDISGNDVYISGYSKFESDFGYWKNAIPVLLIKEPVYTRSVRTTGINVSGNDIFVCGYTTYIRGPGNTYSVSHFWKNEELFRLESDSYYESTEVYDLDVDQNNAYSCGMIGSSRNNIKNRIGLWKNDKQMPIYTTGHASGNAIEVVGGDIYIAGYENNKNEISVAKYWKDGVAVSLTDGLNYASATDIFIDSH